jgi:hypothetical protein
MRRACAAAKILLARACAAQKKDVKTFWVFAVGQKPKNDSFASRAR